MSFEINGLELRKALKEIERAEANGFNYCEAVFEPSGLDGIFVKLSYSDLIEKAHPTDGSLNWGRCQNITKRFKFKDGKLKEVGKTK